jgi:hypothetical protein
MNAEKLDALLRKMQTEAAEYLTSNIGKDEFISRIIYHLDGPEQREAQGIKND